MVTLNDPERAARMRRLRNHGVTHDPAMMSEAVSFDADGARNPWSYEQVELGFNYRMDEMSAALGASQLKKLDRFVARRAALADLYDAAASGPCADHPPGPSRCRLAGLAPLSGADRFRGGGGLSRRGYPALACGGHSGSGSLPPPLPPADVQGSLRRDQPSGGGGVLCPGSSSTALPGDGGWGCGESDGGASASLLHTLT